MLHVLLCEWRYQFPIVRVAEGWRLFAYLHEGSASMADCSYTGLFVEPGVEREVAVLFGVVLPVALIAADVYLLLLNHERFT
jgi:hypothetical protein